MSHKPRRGKATTKTVVSNNDDSETHIPADLKPSDYALLTENQLGIALANVRREIRNAKEDDLPALKERRQELNERLDSFVDLHLRKIDEDPTIQAVTNDLRSLTLLVQKSVLEMQTVKKTINKATEILSYADRFLSMVLK